MVRDTDIPLRNDATRRKVASRRVVCVWLYFAKPAEPSMAFLDLCRSHGRVGLEAADQFTKSRGLRAELLAAGGHLLAAGGRLLGDLGDALNGFGNLAGV